MFYFYQEKNGRQRAFRKANIAQNDKPLCDLAINPEKWVLVKKLPAGTHLCQKCRHLALKVTR